MFICCLYMYYSDSSIHDITCKTLKTAKLIVLRVLLRALLLGIYIPLDLQRHGHRNLSHVPSD